MCADLVIAPDGSAESVTFVGSAPFLAQAARDATKQWKYDSCLENGRPIRVKSYIEKLLFPGPMPKEQSAGQAILPVDEQCRQLVTEQNYSDAEEACSDAVYLSHKLAYDAVLERSTAQSSLGNALILRGKTGESLPH